MGFRLVPKSVYVLFRVNWSSCFASTSLQD